MKNYHDPIGSENSRIIKENLISSEKVICAWGNHGSHLNQATTVLNIVESSGSSVYHLGLTKNNQPVHPLYISYDQKPQKWF